MFLYIVTVARDTNNIDSRPPGAVGWIRTNGSFRYTPLAGERTRPTMRLRHIILVGVAGIEPTNHGLKVRYLTTWLHTHMAGDDRIELSHFGSEPNTLPLG